MSSRTVSVNFSNGDDRHRFNYRSEDVKKVIIQARPHSTKRNTLSGESKHYSHSSGTSEFGSVMNYISSPESAYSTGYSTLHSDDCLSPAAATAATRPPEFYVNSRNGMQYTPSFQLATDDAQVNCPATIPYVDCK